MSKLVYKEGMIVYIAGPITGVADYAEKFRASEEWLRLAFGARSTVHNPAVLPQGMDNRWYMSRCLLMVVNCDVVFAMAGWSASQGAKIEVALARYCGIPVIDGERMCRAAAVDVNADNVGGYCYEY